MNLFFGSFGVYFLTSPSWHELHVDRLQSKYRSWCPAMRRYERSPSPLGSPPDTPLLNDMSPPLVNAINQGMPPAALRVTSNGGTTSTLEFRRGVEIPPPTPTATTSTSSLLTQWHSAVASSSPCVTASMSCLDLCDWRVNLMIMLSDTLFKKQLSLGLGYGLL